MVYVSAIQAALQVVMLLQLDAKDVQQNAPHVLMQIPVHHVLQAILILEPIVFNQTLH
jgi:hypothetical protein